MKRLPLVILVIGVLLAAVAAGCGRAPRYDGRLAAADSLMHSDPDSALAIVVGICRDSLSAEHDRAYRDLLLTQARYRAYQPATSDSDISRALAYYRAHPAEREKLTRAYIYKGAVMEELGHPDSAMLYYKHAEAAADTADYFNLGYVNLRIAQLYQGQYTNDSIVVKRMRKATDYFSTIKDTSYLVTTIGTLGAFFYQSSFDSSRIYLERAISMADAINSVKRYKYESKLAGAYFYHGDFIQAKNLAMDIIRHGADKCDENIFLYYAARSFIRLSRLDSAYWVKSFIPKPTTPLDSMNYSILQAELSGIGQNFTDQDIFTTKAKTASDGMLCKAINSNLREEELNTENAWQRNRLRDTLLFRFILAACSFFILTAILFFTARKHIKNKIEAYKSEFIASRQELEQSIRSYENRLKELEKDYIQKKNELTELGKKNEALITKQQTTHQQVLAIVRDRITVLNELYQAIRVKSYPEVSSRKKSLPLIGIIKELNEQKKLLHITLSGQFWERLKHSIDCELNGIATFVEKNYPSMEEKEYKLFLLLCADVSPQIIKLCLGYDHAVTISNYKIRLVKHTFGVDMKFDEFIQMYLNGNLGKENKCENS